MEMVIKLIPNYPIRLFILIVHRPPRPMFIVDFAEGIVTSIKVDGIEAIGLYSCRKFSHGHGDFRLDDE